MANKKSTRTEKFKKLSLEKQLDYLCKFIKQHTNLYFDFNEVSIHTNDGESIWFNEKRTEFVYRLDYEPVKKYRGNNAKILENALNEELKCQADWYKEWLELINKRIKR